MNKENFIVVHKDFINKMHDLILNKNADYTGNSENPFSNFEFSAELAGTTIEQGILTRMADKIARLKSFLKQGTLKVQDEKIEDTMLDLANYSLILAAYIKDKKARESSPSVRSILEPLKEENQVKPLTTGKKGF